MILFSEIIVWLGHIDYSPKYSLQYAS